MSAKKKNASNPICVFYLRRSGVITALLFESTNASERVSSQLFAIFQNMDHKGLFPVAQWS